MIPKRHFRKFTFSPGAEEAGDELCQAGWWKDAGDWWDISPRFPGWQIESEVVESRQATATLRQRRHRLHKAGNHSLCLAQNCPDVTRDTTGDKTSDGIRDPGRVGSGRDGERPPSHPLAGRTPGSSRDPGHASPRPEARCEHDRSPFHQR
jgi:hypothetical protein